MYFELLFDFPEMNSPCLGPPEQLGCFFPSFFHKIRSHMLQNISKCSIPRLRPFKYKNMCELYDKTQDKYKRGNITVKSYLVLHEEVVGVFHKKITFQQ